MSETPPSSPPAHTEAEKHRLAYWQANVRIVSTLLAIWFLVSFGAGILFVDTLDQVRIPGTGFKFGFFMAQQGAIYIFVILIFVYVWLMNRLDKKFGAHEAFEDKGEGI